MNERVVVKFRLPFSVGSARWDRVAEIAALWGLRLVEQFPGAMDEESASWYLLTPASGALPAQVIAELQQTGDLDAAYFQSEPSPPNI